MTQSAKDALRDLGGKLYNPTKGLVDATPAPLTNRWTFANAQELDTLLQAC